ncbi:DegT/DnrJ/EryC1/StrS family aminotransferase [Noviherbaspirillum sp. ST9]|uniref:DegT/DnrJ/EryC1/StrS family aminotransferase n=1 Tax=Noviherbaspirillum sp. ST9 TaxID=3401606 RepID=UPI003B5876D4
MIPRRRLTLDMADLADWLRAPFTSPAAAAAEVSAFEREFAQAIGVPHAVAVASGRDALCLIIDGLGLKAGDEIVIPAYTLGELLPLLSERGLVLVPADIDPATYNMTVESVRKAITPRTRAILALHLLGVPCDIAGLCGLGLPVIEDCAHAPGATVDGRPVGSFGVAALFSLEANKALSAFGGGVMTTRDDALAAKVRSALEGRPRREWPAMKKMLLKWVEEMMVRSPLYAVAARLMFGGDRAGRFEQFYRQANNRVRPKVAFSGMQARMGRRRLKGIAARQARLEPLWEKLARALPPGFEAQQRTHCGAPVFYNFVARFRGDLNQFRKRALAQGLDVGIFGEVMDDTARMLGHEGCPRSAEVYRQAVLLPLYDGMTEARLDWVIDRLRGIAASVQEQR